LAFEKQLEEEEKEVARIN